MIRFPGNWQLHVSVPVSMDQDFQLESKHSTDSVLYQGCLPHMAKEAAALARRIAFGSYKVLSGLVKGLMWQNDVCKWL